MIYYYVLQNVTLFDYNKNSNKQRKITNYSHLVAEFTISNNQLVHIFILINTINNNYQKDFRNNNNDMNS